MDCKDISCSTKYFFKRGTIAENIAFCESIENINQNLLDKASKIAQIYNFIDKTEEGFNTMVGERGIRLSGGQRQRIAIARAIYQGREILILDEATSALDESTEKNIIDSILQTYKGLTIIMVTHRLKASKIVIEFLELLLRVILKKLNFL